MCWHFYFLFFHYCFDVPEWKEQFSAFKCCIMSGLSIPLIPSAYKLNINRESTNYRLNIDDRQCKNIDTHTHSVQMKRMGCISMMTFSMEHFSAPISNTCTAETEQWTQRQTKRWKLISMKMARYSKWISPQYIEHNRQQ